MDKHDTVKERLIAYLDFKKISKAEFGRKIGVSSAYVTSMRRSIQPDKIERIKENYPELNIQWLITGKGEMIVQKGMQSNAEITQDEEINYIWAGENRYHGVFTIDNHGVMRLTVPHVPFAARAEFANIADDLEPHLEQWESETYIVDKKVTGKYLSFDVKGDSMDDGTRESLQDGDKVLVRELERDFWKDLRIHGHRYWVLVFGSSVLIKEIVNENLEKGTITCHSLNPSPEYHDFTISIDDIRYLYYVIKVKPKERSI